MPKHFEVYAGCLMLGLSALGAPAAAADKVSFGLNWIPEGEHCGFFQAQERGFYKDAGLDVELRPGNPNTNIPLMVASGDLDMGMGSSFTTLNLVKANAPARMVAAFFQKDPQTLVVHPDQGVDTLTDLKGKPIMVAQFSRGEFWQFLKVKFGFTDDQLRPFAYSAAPFLADPKAVQQGYVTEDALLLGKVMPKPPVSILLADYGFDNYATGVFATEKYLRGHESVVQRFVDATRKGYEECVHGDATPAMKAITALNSGEDAALFNFKLSQMKARGLVDGGDAQKLGIGAMTDQRWADFFDVMSSAGVYPKTLDYKAAYTLTYSNPK